VVLVGAIDHLHNPRATVRRSVSMGVLTFLAAIAVFAPAVPVGYAVVNRFPSSRALGDVATGGLGLPDPLAPLLDAVVGASGWLAFPIALVLLFAALNGFHRAFDRVDTRALRDRYLAYLNHRWMLFGLGALVTGLTTSVAFSLGVVVPLYNRGTVSRREALPYIMGANVATLSDTLLVAVVLGAPVAVATVTVLVLAATAVTLAALLWFDPFAGAVLGLLERIVEHRAAFAVFAGALIALPLLLVVA
jgi:sodium-dependent phosphate cotransporter